MSAKSLAGGIGAIIDAGETALAWALEIVRPDATAVRYCTGSRRVTISGQVYSPVVGATFSSIACSLGLNVDNLIISVGDSDVILREDVLDGVWDGSRFRIFQYDQINPGAGLILWHSGFIADIEPRIGAFDIEARDFRQALHQDTTRTHQFTCPNELGDARCRKDLTAFTIAGIAVTAVASNRTFTTTLAEAAGWATEGRILFTTGASANGIWRKVTLHAAAGVLTLDRAAILGVAVGNLLTVVAGCDHTPPTCIRKFSNMPNYGGCPTKPTVSDLSTGELAT
jgi:uncharacterized phage protein (TIGR02218 family)